MSGDLEKPLGTKAYGSIPHLPGSRRGPSDKQVSRLQARICTTQARDHRDVIVVQEKLDGSNVSVAKLGGQIVPLIRSGYPAISSRWEHHRHFASWVFEHFARFDALLGEGERCVGEWMMQAHGTRYDLPHEPLVIFDLMRDDARTLCATVATRCAALGFTTPHVLHIGGPLSIDAALAALEPSPHGALDPVEGAVWRVERGGTVDFLAKFVRAEKVDGKYLPKSPGEPPIYQWLPQSESVNDMISHE